jgi:NTE family protein
MPRTRKTALVVSGGGAKGAFAVGVIKHICSTYRQSGWFDVVGGTSTGALISPMAAVIAAPYPMGAEAMDTLERVYTTVTTPDILEKQNVLELIRRHDCLYESDPLNALIHRHLKPEWFDWLRRPEAPHCYVVYTNFRTGKKVVASPRDDAMTRERFIQAMMASASVPVVMEATKIDGDVCYDGGVRDLLPFATAIDQGVDTIVPIFLDPEQFGEDGGSFERMDKILLRTLAILVDEAGRKDFAMAQLVNIGIRAKRELLGAFAQDAAALRKLQDVFDEDEYKALFGPEKRLLRIISGLRPDEPLTQDSLTFDPVEMGLWVEWGEQKARDVIRESPFA